jgi:hypothetical protein
MSLADFGMNTTSNGKSRDDSMVSVAAALGLAASRVVS